MPIRRAAAAIALALLLAAPAARAVIVERVVAVVGERPILLSELRHRARPYLFRIAAQVQNPSQQAAAETEMFRELLNRLIDERLEEVAADKAHLAVTSEEVDGAIKNIASNSNLGPKELLAEARRQGLTEQDYRDEIRRQVLQGKLVQLRVRGRVRVTEQDARAAYDRWVKDMGNEAMVDLRILALRLDPGASEADVRAREETARGIVARARAGEDFCKLVLELSEDVRTKARCGSQGPQPAAVYQGVPPVFAAMQTMRPGDVSEPVLVQKEAVLVLQMANPKAPVFEDVRPEMTERAFTEAMERQRKQWMAELRRGVYVDVRL